MSNDNDTENEMDECNNCGITERKVFENVPLVALDPTYAEESRGVVKCCTSCGDMKIEAPSNEEIDEFYDEYVDFLEEYELEEQESIESMRR